MRLFAIFARPPRWTPLLVLSAAIFGCTDAGDRPGLGSVSGVITLDGEPAAGLGISFQPKGLRASLGRTDENGRYVLTYIRDIQGAAIGVHEVKIDRISKTENTSAKGLPARYNRKTELTCEVKHGENIFDFELTSDE